jgi:hypothetical protein
MKSSLEVFDFYINESQKLSKKVFTREYTQYTAGFTFCFVVGVVVIESL